MINKPLFRTGDEVHVSFADDTPCTVMYAHAATIEDGLFVVYSVNGMMCSVAAPKTTEAKRIQPFLKWPEDWI